MSAAADNASLAQRAARVIPGGINSSNRATPFPFVVRSAQGAWISDADGRSYLDLHAAFGPIVIGHCDPRVNSAVRAALDRVDLVGVGVTELEVELAERITRLVPSADRVLLTNSGSEATFAALRVARQATGRQDIVKFQGTYHGWHDAVALNVISPREKLGTKDPLSGGILPEVLDHTTVLPFNDIAAIEAFMAERGGEVAAIIVEVIAHNIGCVLPTDDFLRTLRRLATEHGTVLIFDEVITGFRHALGGYQSLCGITPDLTTLGKAIGNGYPIAALVGRAPFMDRFGPGGGVMFAGTFNGHTGGVAAALATIELLEDGSLHAEMARLAQLAADGIARIAAERGIPLTVARYGSVFVPYFFDGPTRSYEDLLENDTEMDLRFRLGMCDRGIFMLPTALKRNHISASHTEADVTRLLEAADDVLRDPPPLR